MFTGIIEALGTIIEIADKGTNRTYTLESSISNELKVDQSVAHNGCCLTVESCNDLQYTVTAVKETLEKTNLQHWQKGQEVNLERSLKVGDRLDGHFVQGHVDMIAKCVKREDENGSWRFQFEHSLHPEFRNVQKGSICINGVSLTLIDPSPQSFSVAIIPYTFEHTNFKSLEPGDSVNIEFDILGKYISAQLAK